MANPREAGSRERWCERGGEKSGVAPSTAFRVGSNSHRVLDREHKNFSVADLAGLRRADHDANGFVHHIIGEHDLDLHFGREIHRAHSLPRASRCGPSAKKPLRFCHRGHFDAQLGEGFARSSSLNGPMIASGFFM